MTLTLTDISISQYVAPLMNNPLTFHWQHEIILHKIILICTHPISQPTIFSYSLINHFLK